MNVCIVGVGAIGGTIGFGLAKAGCTVSGLARGATLEALKTKGLRFTDGGAIESTAIQASDRAEDLGEQDLVVIALKSPSLPALAPSIKALIGSKTMVIPAMNGVPWWFFQGFGGALGDKNLNSIDPKGQIAAAISASSVLGCVVHFGASCPEPGLVRALPKRTLILGEPSIRRSGRRDRLDALALIFTRAGFEIQISDSIQRDVWYKLWGNMTMNPLSALTGATMDKILDDQLVADFCRNIMNEARRVGAKIGCPIEQSVEDRFSITRKLGAFKTSMLQDVEAGRPVELDALLSSAVEIGELVEEPTPNMKILLGLARLKARTLGLYPIETRKYGAFDGNS